MYQQFRKDIDKGRRLLQGTLFVDKHRKLCVLGENAHHGKSMNQEWRGPLDEDGNWCKEEDGGTLK